MDSNDFLFLKYKKQDDSMVNVQIGTEFPEDFGPLNLIITNLDVMMRSRQKQEERRGEEPDTRINCELFPIQEESTSIMNKKIPFFL